MSIGMAWDWEKNTSKFLGSGSYGKVFEAVNKSNGKKGAWKQIDLGIRFNDKELEEIKNEVEILKDDKNEFILEYYDHKYCKIEGTEHLIIVTELMSQGSLEKLLKTRRKLDDKIVILFAKDILTGLKHLHNMDIIHRDIKPDNVLVSDKGRMKLADFGISKRFEGDDSQTTRSRGCIYYRSPQRIANESYGRKADIWSVGGVILKMSSGNQPYGNKTYYQISIEQKGNHGPNIGEASEVFHDILNRMFIFKEENRISATDSLNMELFNIENDEDLRMRCLTCATEANNDLTTGDAEPNVAGDFLIGLTDEMPKNTAGPKSSNKKPQDGSSNAPILPSNGATISAARKSSDEKPESGRSNDPTTSSNTATMPAGRKPSNKAPLGDSSNKATSTSRGVTVSAKRKPSDKTSQGGGSNEPTTYYRGAMVSGSSREFEGSLQPVVQHLQQMAGQDLQGVSLSVNLQQNIQQNIAPQNVEHNAIKLSHLKNSNIAVGGMGLPQSNEPTSSSGDKITSTDTVVQLIRGRLGEIQLPELHLLYKCESSAEEILSRNKVGGINLIDNALSLYDMRCLGKIIASAKYVGVLVLANCKLTKEHLDVLTTAIGDAEYKIGVIDMQSNHITMDMIETIRKIMKNVQNAISFSKNTEYCNEDVKRQIYEIGRQLMVRVFWE